MNAAGAVAGSWWPPLLSLGALVLLAPIVPGVAAKTRAWLTGRRGPPVTQLYSDLGKLSRKGTVYSRTTTWVFRLAPVVLLVTTIIAAALVPLDGTRGLAAFEGDAIAFAYLLALGRFVLVLGALDTGSSFEGMGASREVTFASLVEPALFVSLVGLAVASGQLSLSGMLGPELWHRWSLVAPALALLGASVFVLTLAECARVPVDDPTTHLELTMIHEVMILDHSGPDLALILYASALKLGLFIALLMAMLVPRFALGSLAATAMLVLALVAGGIAVGVVESVMARLRLSKVPLYIAGGGALAFSGLILLLR